METKTKLHKQLNLVLEVGNNIHIDCNKEFPDSDVRIHATIQAWAFTLYTGFAIQDVLDFIDFPENKNISFDSINLKIGNNRSTKEILELKLNDESCHFLYELFRSSNQYNLDRNGKEALYDVVRLDTENPKSIATLNHYKELFEDSQNNLEKLLYERPWESRKVLVVVKLSLSLTD